MDPFGIIPKFKYPQRIIHDTHDVIHLSLGCERRLGGDTLDLFEKILVLNRFELIACHFSSTVEARISVGGTGTLRYRFRWITMRSKRFFQNVASNASKYQ